MSHLSQEQLSAHADGALTGRALERAALHLADCVECRIAYERMVRDTTALGRALAHDPGDDYFATFADRVAERIAREPARAAGAPVAPPRAGGAAARWLPWATGLATLAVAAADRGGGRAPAGGGSPGRAGAAGRRAAEFGAREHCRTGTRPSEGAGGRGPAG